MEQFFSELFRYNHHCNQQLFSVFEKEQGRVSAKSVQLFNHLVNAHAVWLSRILKENQPFGAWVLHEPAQLKEIDHNNDLLTEKILQTQELIGLVSYVNSLGQSYTNSVRDILFHIINHSTYHRGQIAMDHRQTGVEPVPTDYIFFKR